MKDLNFWTWLRCSYSKPESDGLDGQENFHFLLFLLAHHSNLIAPTILYKFSLEKCVELVIVIKPLQNKNLLVCCTPILISASEKK